MNADGSNQKRLTRNSGADEMPSWSPNGNQIAFGSDRDGNYEIEIMNADGSNQQRLTNNTAYDSQPFWSRRNQIAFVSKRDGNDEIYVMDIDGSNQRRLTNNPAVDQEPSWSPDGSKIAFVSNRDDKGNSEIYVMNADGSNQQRLSNDPAYDLSPSWSPDGTHIVFASTRAKIRTLETENIERDPRNPLDNTLFGIRFKGIRKEEDAEIYVMKSDGTKPKRLTRVRGVDRYPHWFPSLEEKY